MDLGLGGRAFYGTGGSRGVGRRRVETTNALGSNTTSPPSAASAAASSRVVGRGIGGRGGCDTAHALEERLHVGPPGDGSRQPDRGDGLPD